MIYPHTNLKEAINDHYVVRIAGDYKVSNEYWRWCHSHSKPFVVITLTSLRHQYARVEIDLYNLSVDGFSSGAGYEIFRTILGYPLKPRSSFFMSPILINACVATSNAVPFALYLYDSAIDEGVVLDPADYCEQTMKRYTEKVLPERGFNPFSADVYPAVLAELRKRDFWDSMLPQKRKSLFDF